MLRGIFIGRYLVFGIFTTTMLGFRALDKFVDNNFVDFMVNPLLAYIVYLSAAIVVLYPYMVGKKALIIAPLMVIGIAFFVYAYYVIP